MAAKGTVLKNNITKEILKLFPGSFIYNKEIRIPGIEENENIQIKCVLTCAKTNVEETKANMGVAMEGSNEINFDTATPNQSDSSLMPTEEEKKNIEILMKRLNL
jgi:hypothetical protein